MKAKYEKMIDEYVKKHYGDLDRGVLSPEVKYKVLFKIYRKKYRKEKILAETFSRMLTKEEKEEKGSWSVYTDNCDTCSGCEHYVPMHAESRGLTQDAFVVPASCKLGKSMTACCPFHSVKVDEKEAQKEMRTCDRCRYSIFKTVTNGREAAAGKLWCIRNDFYASGVMTCDWFEDKESSCLDWMHNDITWCCRECGDKDCGRNKVNRRCKEGLYSVADMYDPFKCPVDAEMPEEKKK